MAQANVSVSINSPLSGANLSSGSPFSFEITITNTGAEAIDMMDSILIVPSANGNAISNSAGILEWIENQSIAANGGTYTFSQSLEVSGGAAGVLDLCCIIAVRGAGWTGVTESDITDNTSCVNVNWATGTVGISELRLASLEDNSFYNNGVYNIRLANTNSRKRLTFELVNLTGKVVQSSSFDVNGSEVSEDISLNSPSKGIYLARLSSNGTPVSARKIVVQ